MRKQLKQIEAKISKTEVAGLDLTILITTAITLSWGLLHGFLRQTNEQDWQPIVLWGAIGFVLGPGLGIALRFPSAKLRPWPQFSLAVVRGIAYGAIIFFSLQFCALYGEWQIIPQEKPSGRDIEFMGIFGFVFLSILFVCARQLTEYIATVHTAGAGWSRMLRFGMLGLPSGVLCWSIYFQIPFRETWTEGFHAFQEILPIMLICSIPIVFIGMALGIVSTAHKISIAEITDGNHTTSREESV